MCFDEGPCPQDVCDQPYVKTGIYSGVGVECTSDYFTQSGVSSQRSQHLSQGECQEYAASIGGNFRLMTGYQWSRGCTVSKDNPLDVVYRTDEQDQANSLAYRWNVCAKRCGYGSTCPTTFKLGSYSSCQDSYGYPSATEAECQAHAIKIGAAYSAIQNSGMRPGCSERTSAPINVIFNLYAYGGNKSYHLVCTGLCKPPPPLLPVRRRLFEPTPAPACLAGWLVAVVVARVDAQLAAGHFRAAPRRSRSRSRRCRRVVALLPACSAESSSQNADFLALLVTSFSSSPSSSLSSTATRGKGRWVVRQPQPRGCRACPPPVYLGLLASHTSGHSPSLGRKSVRHLHRPVLRQLRQLVQQCNDLAAPVSWLWVFLSFPLERTVGMSRSQKVEMVSPECN